MLKSSIKATLNYNHNESSRSHFHSYNEVGLQTVPVTIKSQKFYSIGYHKSLTPPSFLKREVLFERCLRKN